MRFHRTDILATGFVGVALATYLIWLVTDDAPAPSAVRVVTGLVLVLGFAASAIAVVPSFSELLHGSRSYLAVASLLGLGATVAGALALVNADLAMLAILVSATVVMWAMATTRHSLEGAAVGGHRSVGARHHVPRHG
jgi:hypothetical protein